MKKNYDEHSGIFHKWFVFGKLKLPQKTELIGEIMHAGTNIENINPGRKTGFVVGGSWKNILLTYKLQSRYYCNNGTADRG